MNGKETRKSNLVRFFEFVTLAPAILGTFSALALLLIQCWRWWESGVWKPTPLAEFVPPVLVEWAATKDGGIVGLKNLVLSLLSLHASVWFFVGGCLSTLLLSEMAKPWLRDKI
jgi:hypothetical protein